MPGEFSRRLTRLVEVAKEAQARLAAAEREIAELGTAFGGSVPASPSAESDGTAVAGDPAREVAFK